jgi:hypothetical protein
MTDLISRADALAAESLWLKFDGFGEVESVSCEPLPDHRQYVCDRAIAALPAATPTLAEALKVQTSGGERAAHSHVGHSLTESSWHIHLAGFRSRDEAETALAALKGGA